MVREDAANPEVLHPANEDDDLEHVRARLSHWVEQEGPRGRAARELAELERRIAAGQGGATAAGATTAGSAGGGPPAQATEEPHGGRSRSGEPKKHPRPPEETTPAPGRGRVGFDPEHPERVQRTAPERTVRPPAHTRGPKGEEK